jgi:hypothetical protein
MKKPPGLGRLSCGLDDFERHFQPLSAAQASSRSGSQSSGSVCGGSSGEMDEQHDAEHDRDDMAVNGFCACSC